MDASTFAALAEPHRLEIVELLRTKPRPVNEIVVNLHMNQPQVSKHLKVLADAGLVEVRPVAQQRIYALRPQPLKELDKWLERYRKMWDASFDRLEALLRQEKRSYKRND